MPACCWPSTGRNYWDTCWVSGTSPSTPTGRRAGVEEVFVRGQYRARGVGRALMSGFEQWAAVRDCALVALATRRAAPFYRALGYEESAVYFRKILGDQAGTCGG
jgi:GNAT superfamily N-acetyltransferase